MHYIKRFPFTLIYMRRLTLRIFWVKVSSVHAFGGNSSKFGSRLKCTQLKRHDDEDDKITIV